jgi:ferredoxin-thioredoxin reductase catalytic subunit
MAPVLQYPAPCFIRYHSAPEGYDLEKLCACSIGTPDDTSLAERHCALFPTALSSKMLKIPDSRVGKTDTLNLESLAITVHEREMS